MVINLWLFLTFGAMFSALLVLTMTININKRKLKELELEALKVKIINLKAEVEATVTRHLKPQNDRIAVIEAIVTDKSKS
jgi:hypothetical protein